MNPMLDVIIKSFDKAMADAIRSTMHRKPANIVIQEVRNPLSLHALRYANLRD